MLALQDNPLTVRICLYTKFYEVLFYFKPEKFCFLEIFGSVLILTYFLEVPLIISPFPIFVKLFRLFKMDTHILIFVCDINLNEHKKVINALLSRPIYTLQANYADL